ncbi:MAG: glycosyl transferase family 1, partial [Planctomycetota bacterium]
MPDVHTPENHVADLHVALLLNFIAPNHSHVLREIAGRVRRLTVIASTPLEDNRQWQTDHDGLDVIVQRTWTLRRRLKHVMGFREQNYLHVPLDTRRQLRRLSPDVVASTELGPRTFAAKRYCNANSVPHMVCVNDSRHSE